MVITDAVFAMIEFSRVASSAHVGDRWQGHEEPKRRASFGRGFGSAFPRVRLTDLTGAEYPSA